jgi:hypothetical protein
VHFVNADASVRVPLTFGHLYGTQRQPDASLGASVDDKHPSVLPSMPQLKFGPPGGNGVGPGGATPPGRGVPPCQCCDLRYPVDKFFV